jgi:WD40 repeat protein
VPSSQLLTLEAHTGRVDSLSFSGDGKLLASASEDGTVRIWDVRNRRTVTVFKGHQGRVVTVRFSPDGTKVASGGTDRTVRIWDPVTGKQDFALRGHSLPLRSLAFSPDGGMLASSSHDTTVKLWEVKTGVELGTLVGHTGAVWGVSFSPDGTLLASVSWDGTMRLWNTARKAEEARHLAPTRDGSKLLYRCVEFAPDGRAIATGDGLLRLVSLTSGRVLFAPMGHVADVVAVAFSRDGRFLLSAGGAGEIKIWDLRRQTLAATLWGNPRSEIWSMALSPDGRLLASGSADGKIRVWDASKICRAGGTGSTEGDIRQFADGLQRKGEAP